MKQLFADSLRQPALQLWQDVLEHSPPVHREERLRAVAAQFGADLRTAALQLSAALDIAAALIVGAHTRLADEVRYVQRCAAKYDGESSLSLSFFR
jgi:hypothetical protein